MGMSFDDKNFADNLRDAMGEQVNAAMNTIASNLQSRIDAFCDAYLGRSFIDVRAALVQEGPTMEIRWEHDSEIDQWAKAISEGHRIVLEVPDVDL